ncbi:uncharacterized protein LOC124414104 [Diprion similis]|uniref:uncharacterized protein LOC124414104 n=1 Tax=Diprion similis TaxID=362088 RepID=UPI001EF75902|nr:uncharacterized protein LOC124414104 [Diprion similis]
MSEDWQSVVTSRDRDCLGCRLVSGGGLIGAGIYVAYHSKQFNKITGKSVMFSFAAVLAGLGTARIMRLPPFDSFGNA